MGWALVIQVVRFQLGICCGSGVGVARGGQEEYVQDSGHRWPSEGSWGLDRWRYHR